MKQETMDIARYRLEKAKNTLSDVNKFFPEATLESTVNRIYYAMFYAVNALLVISEFASSKHSGVRAIFNREFIHTGIIEKRFGQFYSDMFNNRQEGDYRDFVIFDKQEVEIWIKNAREFISEIQKLVHKSISN
ncbi:MAG: HEPN domain-containing protein [bacterium]